MAEMLGGEGVGVRDTTLAKHVVKQKLKGKGNIFNLREDRLGMWMLTWALQEVQKQSY